MYWRITYQDDAGIYILDTIVVEADSEDGARVLAAKHRAKNPLPGQTWKSPISAERIPASCPAVYPSGRQCGRVGLHKCVGDQWAGDKPQPDPV